MKDESTEIEKGEPETEALREKVSKLEAEIKRLRAAKRSIQSRDLPEPEEPAKKKKRSAFVSSSEVKPLPLQIHSLKQKSAEEREAEILEKLGKAKKEKK